jgi:hypothetical protein
LPILVPRRRHHRALDEESGRIEKRSGCFLFLRTSCLFPSIRENGVEVGLTR